MALSDEQDLLLSMHTAKTVADSSSVLFIDGGLGVRHGEESCLSALQKGRIESF